MPELQQPIISKWKKHLPACFQFLAVLLFFVFLAYLLIELQIRKLRVPWVDHVPGIEFLLMAVVVYPAGLLRTLGMGEPFVSPTVGFTLLNLSGAVLLYLVPAVFCILITRSLRRKETGGAGERSPLVVRTLEILIACFWVVIIPLCYGFLAIYGMAFIGAGHGSDYFGSLALSPFVGENVPPQLALVFWPAFAFFLAFRRIEFCRKAAWCLLSLHYAGVVWLSLTTEWEYVWRVLDALFSPAALHLSIYLGSQICFCFLLIHAGKPKKTKSTDMVTTAG